MKTVCSYKTQYRWTMQTKPPYELETVWSKINKSHNSKTAIQISVNILIIQFATFHDKTGT